MFYYGSSPYKVMRIVMFPKEQAQFSYIAGPLCSVTSRRRKRWGRGEVLCMFVDHFGIYTTRSWFSLLVVGQASPGVAYDDVVFTALEVSSVSA